MSDFTTIGSWTSQTLTNSLGSFRTGFNGYWGTLRFRYEAGDAESSVQVDILDSSDAALQSNITLTDSGSYKTADLSVYGAVRSANIKVRLKLQAQTKSPVISDITLQWQDTENS